MARTRFWMLLGATLLLAAAGVAQAQTTLTWDNNGGTTGPQDGSGTWNSSNTNWWNGSSNVAWSAGNIAAFGNSGTAGTVTVSGSVNAGGLSFGSLSSGSYALNSGTIGLTTGGTIALSRGFTLGSTATLSGSNISVLAGGSTQSQIFYNGALAATGTLSLRADAGSSLYFTRASAVNPFGQATIDIGNNVTLQLTAGDYLIPNAITVSGSGSANGGAIRLDNTSNSRVFSGPITLAGDTYILNQTGSPVWFTGGFGETAGGAKGLSITNNGPVYLQGQSTYTGTTVLAQNTVVLEGGDNRLPAGSVLQISTLSFSTLVIGGTSGAISQTVAGVLNAAGARPDRVRIAGGASGTSTFNFAIASGTNTFVGTIGGTGNGNNLAITKSGAGVLLLSNTVAGLSGGVHTYTGTTSVTGGTLVMAGTAILPSTPIDIGAAGTFSLGGSGTQTYPVVSLSGAGALTLGPNTVQVGSNNASTSFSGIISGSASAGLTKVGTGVLTLSGSNSFPGLTNISEGVVAVSTIGNAGTANPLGTSGTVNLGTSTTTGTLRYTGAGETTSRAFVLTGTTGAGGAIEANGSGPLVVSGSVSAATGDKTLTLAGSNTDNNSIGAIPQPATSGTTSLVKTGAGTWLLTGSSGYRGSTSVDQGTLLLGANAQSSGQNGGLGFSSGAPITIGNAAGSGTAALLLQGGVQVDTRILTVPTGSQLTVLGGANTTGTATFGSAGSAEIQFQRNIRLQAGTGGTVVFANIWSATGGGSVPANNVTIGTSDNAGTVRLDSVLGTTGAVNASYGKLRLGVTGALPSASAINIGVAGTSSAEVDYAATGETISRNVFALGNGRNRIRNSGTGTLTLSGTLTKNGTILELAGGTFNVTGPITGTSAGSDLYVNGATVTLTNSNNSYNGPTYVYGNGTLNLAASNVIPSGSTLTLGGTGGGDTGTGTLVVGSSFDSVGGLLFGTGGGTVMMTASGTAGSAQVTAPAGTVALAGGTLDLTGSGTTSGLYRLFSAQTVTGTFASVTGASPAYQVVTTATTVDYQQRAVLGTLSVTNPATSIITGGSAAFTYTVQNSALSGGAGLSFSGTGASNVGGSSAGSAAAGSTSGAVSGMVFTGTSVGAGQQGTFTVTAPTAYGATTSTGTVSVTVLDHATSSLGASLLLSDTISLGTWNYATQTWESGTDSGLFTLFNIASSYGAGLTADLSLVSVSGAANGFSTDLNTYTDIAGGSSRGYYVLGNTASWTTSGTQTATFTIQMSDKTGMSGAIASNTLTLTASVIVVPEPATLALAAVGLSLGGWATLRRRRK